MRNSIFLILTAIMIITFLSSCQKELSYSPNSPTTPAGADSGYLDKYYIYQISNSKVDTLAKFIFNYDTQKRVIGVDHFIKDSGTTSYNPTDLWTDKYYYNGMDSLPYKLLRIFDSNINSLDTMATYFYYDPNGRLLRDSSYQDSKGYDSVSTFPGPYHFIYHIVNNYSYNSNQIIKNQVYKMVWTLNPSHSWYHNTIDSAKVDANHNVINYKEIDTDMYNPQNFTTSIVNSIYDNYKAPYSRLNILNTLSPIPSFIDYGISEYRQNHNLISFVAEIKPVFGTGYTLTSNFNNTYNNNGFLVNSIYFDPTLNVNYGYYYKYKAL